MTDIMKHPVNTITALPRMPLGVWPSIMIVSVPTGRVIPNGMANPLVWYWPVLRSLLVNSSVSPIGIDAAISPFPSPRSAVRISSIIRVAIVSVRTANTYSIYIS